MIYSKFIANNCVFRKRIIIIDHEWNSVENIFITTIWLQFTKYRVQDSKACDDHSNQNSEFENPFRMIDRPYSLLEYSLHFSDYQMNEKNYLLLTIKFDYIGIKANTI